MSQTIHLQHAYVMHRIPYKDTSFLVDLFTVDYGLVRVVARGVRRPKSPLRGILQPFHPLLISARGKGELLTLTHAELERLPFHLSHWQALSGLYINELIVRFLESGEAEEKLFRAYHLLLTAMHRQKPLESVLRLFEKYLLHALGYGLELTREHKTGAPIHPEHSYVYVSGRGFLTASDDHFIRQRAYRGAHLLALSRGVLNTPETCREAKYLLREALSSHLGQRPLKSIDLFKV